MAKRRSRVQPKSKSIGGQVVDQLKKAGKDFFKDVKKGLGPGSKNRKGLF